MVNKSTIVIFLILAVVAVFLFKPDLLGMGVDESTTLAVAPTTQTQDTVVTKVSCETDTECQEAGAQYGVPSQYVGTCQDSVCVFSTGGAAQ